MKKLLLSLSFIIGLSLVTKAQTEGPVHKITVGPDVMYPFGLAADSYKLGYGGSVMGEYNIGKKLNLTAYVGYSKLAYKSEVKKLYTDLKDDFYIPIRLGAKYYFGPVYGAADAGIGLSLKEDRNSSFAYTATVGKAFSVSPKSSLDIGVRYEGWSMYRDQVGITFVDNYSFVGLRLAYVFGL